MNLISTCLSGRWSLVMVAMATLLIGSSVNAADWAYDFDGPEPAGWFTGSVTIPPGGTSGTFMATIEAGGPTGNYLQLEDTTPADSGGSFSAIGGTSDVFSDVVVAADVNITLDSNDDLGVLARADIVAGSSYYGHVDFERGNACITKIKEFTIGTDIVCTADGLFDASERYTVELSAVGGATTTLTLDVTGSGGTETVMAVDDGTIMDFGAAYTSGTSGVFVVPLGATLDIAFMNPITGTFDNVSSSVPEPGSSLLSLVGCLGLLAWRRKR